MAISRKDFLKASGLGALAIGTASFASVSEAVEKSASEEHTLRIGLASYTLRNYSLDELIDIVLRLQLTDVSFKSFHLPYEASPEELGFIRDKVKARGINLYGGGVIYMNTAEEVENYFNYAKYAGLSIIIGAPKHNLLQLVEKKVKESNIKMAIHNHGPEDGVFPSPESVYNKIKDLDSRIGLCIDTGHTFRLNLDPAAELIKYKSRLFDVHIKDIDEQTPKGNNVEIGHGKMDIPKILSALKDINYTGVVAIEYEKDGEHAIYGLSESVGYIRGILNVI
ncbi:TIM barrel protein [Maribacter sp. X9]|uniref:TIM barrel protein n=1 Tax=Maribacter sp. X9 TaxID=3402159 RepID=UPI003AF38880